MTSGIVHVFSAIWVDSGYMSASVYAAFGRISHFSTFWWTLGDDFRIVSVFSAELGPTVDTCRLQSTRRLVEFHTFSQTTEISQLQYVTRWSMLLLCMSCLTCLSLCNDRAHGPDCSSDLLLPQLLYAVADVPVVQVEQVHFSRCGAAAAPMVQTVRRTFCFHSCCTRLSMLLFCRSSRFTSPSWRRGRFHGPDCSIAWRCRRCSSCAVVDVAVFMPRHVPDKLETD